MKDTVDHICKNGHINPPLDKRGSCKTCQSKYKKDHRLYLLQKNRERSSNNRIKSIEYLGNKCIDCSESNKDCLVFDHTVDKKVNIACILHCSWEKILEELVKCELVCENCHLIRTRQRSAIKFNTNEKKIDNRNKKRQVILNYLGGKCIDCNNNNSDVLVFDHIDTKLYNIGSNILSSFESIKSEIDKCELVCANCHRLRTISDRKSVV